MSGAEGVRGREENSEREPGNVEEEDGGIVEDRGREAENDVFWSRDWVLSMSKGSRFHCASFWIPFMALA